MRRLALLLALALAGCGGGTPAPQGPSAKVFLGTFLLLDGNGTRAGAVRVVDGRITDILAQDDPALEGERIDFGQGTVVPGLTDAHLHLRGIGQREREVDLVGTASEADVIRRVAEAARTTPAGQWIRGRGWDQNDWEDTDFPTHTALSAAVPDHPVLLRRVDGHAAWVNEMAMRRARIDAGTEAPEGGEILTDARGRPTGVFIDNAVDLLMRQLPAPDDHVIGEDLRRAMTLCADAGLTTVHDMGVDATTLEQLRALERAGAMPIRVVVYLDGSDPRTVELLQTPPDREGRLIVDGVKHYIDGALGSRGAALFADYSDREGHRGLLVQSPEALGDHARAAHAAGYRIAIHAIGDRGIATALDAIINAQGGDASPRHRIEHVQVIRPSDVRRLAEHSITASMQPTHATSDMPWAEARVGPERIGGAYAWRTLLEADIVLAFGSDAPVESHRPMLGVYAAVTRQDAAGEPEGGWRPDQRLTAVEALRAFSRGAAEAIERDDLGRIEVGAIADFTVLGANPVEIAPRELRDVPIVATVVEGDVRYVQ